VTDNNSKRFESDSFFRQFFFVVFYRKKLVLTTIGSVFGLALLAAVFLPPTYVSSAKFAITISQQLDPLKKEPQYDIKNQMLRILLGQKELILSTQVLEQTVRQAFPKATAEEIPELIEDLKKRITVAPPKGEDFEGSNVFYVSVAAPSAARAHELAVLLTGAYLDVYASTTKSKSLYSYDFYNIQVEKLNAEMDDKGTKLRTFEIKHASRLVDILNMEGGTNKTSVEIGPKALLTEATRNRQHLVEQAQSQAKVIEILEDEAAKNTIPVIMADMEGTGKALTAYRSKVTQLQLQLAEIKTQFTSNYEPVRQVEKELAQTTTLLRDEFSAIIKAKKIEVQSLQAQIQEVDKVIRQLENNLISTAQERSAYESLKQDYLLARDAYSDARSKMEQARLAVSINQEKQDITKVEAPALPVKPAKPNRPLLAALGLFAGLFFGLAVALTLDYFDHTLRTPEEVERYLQLPCLGSVSHFSD